MAGVWKRDGTVAVTNGSKKVTGTGTTFADAKNGVAKGHLFCMTTGTTVDLYEVDYVVSNTELHLVQAFRGTTGTGKAYEIITTFSDSIPEFARKLNASLSYYQSQSDMVQQLFTSDAAEITVTAPDGTTHKLIPWKRVTSEGEGQAARAKVEADRAKTEADRSGTEADRAAGIVALAALPLPDVWAPLSDSLRLITGYGRDVLVGSDVVARMVNFSRNSTATYIGKDGLLKTAAANEPRFEKEGLLIEGQSQNLVIRSEGVTFSTANASFQTLTNNVSGVLPMPGQRISFAPNNGETNANLIQTPITLTGGQTYTYSTHLKVEAGDASAPENCINIYAENGVNVGARAVIRKTGDGIYRVSVTFTVGGTGSQTVYIRFNRIGSPSAVWTAVVGGVQVENLSFASAYIPTAGAAVTRAADAIQIPYAGNGVPLSDMQMTMSAVIKTNARPGEPTALIDALDSAPNVGVFLSLDGRIHTRVFDVEWITGITPDLTKEQVVALSFNGATGAVVMRVGDKVVTGTVVVPKGISRSAGNIGLLCRSGTNTRTGFGSVRDFKIWHKFFTVDQLKAIK